MILKDDGLAYKDMKDSYYYAVTISYFMVIVFGSIFIPTVDTIFEFIGAIVGTSLGFVMPGIFYIRANTKFPENRDI